MMFILNFNSDQWCDKYWFTHFSVVSEVNSASLMFRLEAPRIVDISISFSTILGVLLGCILTLAWTKYSRQGPKETNIFPHKIPDKTKDILASRIIHSAIKDLISSQYVLKDREHFKSLLQTPLRTSLEQLRLVANSLVDENEINASPNTLSSNNTHNYSYRVRTKTEHCNALNTIVEQVKFMDSLQTNASLLHIDETGYSPILPVCPLWFRGVIRELLVNAVKHNQKDKKINIEVSTSLQGTNFVVCIADNGVGLSSNVTNRLDDINVVKNTHGSNHLFANDESINLVGIKRRLHQLKGSLEVVSARHFLTKIILKLPLLENIEKMEQVHLDHRKSSAEADGSALKTNFPKLLLISKQNEAQLDNLQSLTQHFNLICVNSVEKGLELVFTQKPDCVLFDSDICTLSGIYTQAWLEQSAEFTEVPMVILENQCKVGPKLSALQSGISAVITKSADTNDITFAIEKVMHEKQRVLEQVSEGIANYHLSLANTNNINDQEGVKFLENFTHVLQKHFTNEKFNRPEAAKLMLMTEKTLARRLNQHYKLGFTEKLRQFRLHEAKDLLVSGAKVTTASYDTGFSSPSYFAQCFRAEFGFAPSMLSKTL